MTDQSHETGCAFIVSAVRQARGIRFESAIDVPTEACNCAEVKARHDRIMAIADRIIKATANPAYRYHMAQEATSRVCSTAVLDERHD